MEAAPNPQPSMVSQNHKQDENNVHYRADRPAAAVRPVWIRNERHRSGFVVQAPPRVLNLRARFHVAILMGGGPSAIYGSEALMALEPFEAAGVR